MKSGLMLLVLGLFLSLSSPSYSENYTYPADNPVFSIDFPDDWKITPEGELLHAMPQDESIYVSLWALQDGTTMDSAVNAVDQMVADMVTDFSAGDVDYVDVNGIRFTEVAGQGRSKDNGTPINASVDFFSPDGRQVFVLIYFGDANSEKNYEGQLAEIVQSIHRM